MNAATATFAAGWRRPVEKDVIASPGRLKRARTLPLSVGRASPGDFWRLLLDGDPTSEEDSRTRSMQPRPAPKEFPKEKSCNSDTILPC